MRTITLCFHKTNRTYAVGAIELLSNGFYFVRLFLGLVLMPIQLQQTKHQAQGQQAAQHIDYAGSAMPLPERAAQQ